MALKPLCLVLLWGLTLLIPGVTSLCNVTCSTDYDVSLNCSCSGSVLTYPVLLQATCSSEEDTVNGSCEVNSTQSWCIMHVETLYFVASIGTMCTASARQQGQVVTKASESPPWALSDVVKFPPPSTVQVTNTDGFYNITWDNQDQKDCFEYRVRIRESKDLSKDPVHLTSTETKYILLAPKQLQPCEKYTVDVQAKLCPDNIYLGPWSEWSATAEWRTTGYVSCTGNSEYWKWWFLLVIIPVLILLGFSKMFWQRKIRLITFIPRPNDFFDPLYHTYGGNFKAWVKPVFSEYDYPRINSHVQMMSEKPHDILQWNNEKQSYRDDSEMKQNDQFLHMLQPDSNSLLLLPFQDGGSSQGTSHSMGHISIHTVTLSGEEFEEEAMSQSSVNTLRSYQDGESFGSFEEDNREHAGYDLGGPQVPRMDRQSGMLPQHENQISNELSVEDLNFQPHDQFNEPERLSLDSFASNEQSEDGYPHVDLDTIDSGFVECSSPGASDSITAEQMDSDLFHEHKNLNSNYVKQWMICNTIQEDSGNSETESQ